MPEVRLAPVAGADLHVRDDEDVRRLYGDIEAVVTAVRNAGGTPCTLSDALAAE